MSEVYKTFSCCIPISGYFRSVIYDLQRKEYCIISNKLCDLLKKDCFSDIEIIETANQEIKTGLIQNDIIFKCQIDDTPLFPPLSTEYSSPSKIKSCILDFKNVPTFDLEKVVTQLDSLGTINLQIRFFEKPKSEEVINILSQFDNSLIYSIELIISNNILDLESIIKQFPRITSIILWNCEKCSIKSINNCSVISTNESFVDVSQCGCIEKELFLCSQDNYIESLNFNSCLNRKIAIDCEGNIKNCPSCSVLFGNINNVSLDHALKHMEFQNIWMITKDMVDVCKDCEFRYMCIDCRVYIKNPRSLTSQPLKCMYNPYISKWKGEDGYIPVEECGTYSLIDGFKVNKDTVDSINTILWK